MLVPEPTNICESAFIVSPFKVFAVILPPSITVVPVADTSSATKGVAVSLFKANVPVIILEPSITVVSAAIAAKTSAAVCF